MRLVTILGLLGLLLPATEAPAQLSPLAEGGARSIALGRAATALGDDVWGVANPAAWATIDRGTAAVFVSQAFGLPELRLGSAAAAHPTHLGVAALGARTYGFDDFRENVFTVGLGRALPVSPTRQVHAGLALRHTSISIPEFGTAGAIGISVGVLVDLIPGLRFGALAHNLNRPTLSKYDPLETRLDAGLAFEAHDRGVVLLAVSKDLDFPLSVRGGLEVRPVNALFLRAGFSTEPTRFSSGLGVVIGRIRADVASEYHQLLGWTPAFEVGVQW